MSPFCIENENREKYEAGIKITETAIANSGARIANPIAIGSAILRNYRTSVGLSVFKLTGEY